MRRLLQFAACACALSTASLATADKFPARPITMVVGYAPGGSTDVRTRILAQYMRPMLGQPVLVENVSGRSGAIATTRVVQAPPDGYTLVSGDWSTHVVNSATYDLQYDLLHDFEPVALLSSTPLAMVSRNAVPATTFRELLDWLRANQGKATYGTSGTGSPSHIAGLLLQKVTGINFHFVPYRGGALVLQDLIAGHIDVAFNPASSVLSAVREGKIRSYAVSSSDRWFAAPDIPTVDDAGLPELRISLWGGLWAPKAAPKTAIDKLNAAVVDALSNPTARQRLAELGETIPPPEQQTSRALAAFHKAEMEKWQPIIKAMVINRD